MIELERDESQDIQVWADNDFSHVIVQETEDTYLYGSGGPGWYVRDENAERGPVRTFAEALDIAEELWTDEVTLAPANRLVMNIQGGDENDGMQFLTEYLAEYGAAGIDVQALANLVLANMEG